MGNEGTGLYPTDLPSHLEVMIWASKLGTLASGGLLPIIMPPPPCPHPSQTHSYLKVSQQVQLLTGTCPYPFPFPFFLHLVPTGWPGPAPTPPLPPLTSHPRPCPCPCSGWNPPYHIRSRRPSDSDPRDVCRVSTVEGTVSWAPCPQKAAARPHFTEGKAACSR